MERKRADEKEDRQESKERGSGGGDEEECSLQKNKNYLKILVTE